MAQIYKWNWDMRRKSAKSSGSMSGDDSKDFNSSCIEIIDMPIPDKIIADLENHEMIETRSTL